MILLIYSILVSAAAAPAPKDARMPGIGPGSFAPCALNSNRYNQPSAAFTETYNS